MSNFPDAQKVYELAAVFRERVIEQGRSFLWPDEHIWTVENAHELLEFETSLYDRNAGASPPSLHEVAEAVHQHSQLFSMLAADAQAVCHLFWSSLPSTTIGHVTLFAEYPGLPAVDASTLDSLRDQADSSIPAYFSFYKGGEFQRHLSSLFVLYKLRSQAGNNPSVTELERAVALAKDQVWDGMVWNRFVWPILHVLYPKEIVAGIGMGDRQRIIRRFGKEAGVNPQSGEFEQLKTIREHVDRHFGTVEPFDFYSWNIHKEWQKNQQRLEGIRRKTGYEIDSTIGWDAGDEQRQGRTGGCSRIVDERSLVYEVADLFSQRVIEEGMSLLWPEEQIWTEDVLKRFLEDFVQNKAVKGQSCLRHIVFKLKGRILKRSKCWRMHTRF